MVRVDRGDVTELAVAYGEAHRGRGIANTVETRFGVASAGKGLTALAVATLVEDGTLQWTTTARSLLGDDLPLIDDAVTVEQLMAHRSGIGDYLDEDLPGDISDYAMTVPVHELATTEQFLAVLDGFPTKFPPGDRFSYCNGGFVVLALIAERASGVGYHDLVRSRVCEPAGMDDTDFLRSDELPGGVALGYVPMEGTWTNVFHLPVRGTGDGGIYSTVADLHRRRTAMFAGRIVPQLVAELVEPAQRRPRAGTRYGLGFWLHPSSGRHARGLRRRCLVPQHARPDLRGRCHRHREHVRGRLAVRGAPRGTTGGLTHAFRGGASGPSRLPLDERLVVAQLAVVAGHVDDEQPEVVGGAQDRTGFPGFHDEDVSAREVDRTTVDVRGRSPATRKISVIIACSCGSSSSSSAVVANPIAMGSAEIHGPSTQPFACPASPASSRIRAPQPASERRKAMSSA